MKETEEEAQKQRVEAMRDESTHSAEEEVAKKHARADMDTEAGGEMGSSQSHSRNAFERGTPTAASNQSVQTWCES